MNEIITNESTVTSRPPFKTHKTGSGIDLTVALPGVTKDKLVVNAEGQLLVRALAASRLALARLNRPEAA